VSINGKAVAGPVSGLIPVPDTMSGAVTIVTQCSVATEFKTKLLVGSANPGAVFLNDTAIRRMVGTERRLAADTESDEMTLQRGTHAQADA
jgi:hypothetical protein